MIKLQQMTMNHQNQMFEKMMIMAGQRALGGRNADPTLGGVFAVPMLNAPPARLALGAPPVNNGNETATSRRRRSTRSRRT